MCLNTIYCLLLPALKLIFPTTENPRARALMIIARIRHPLNVRAYLLDSFE